MTLKIRFSAFLMLLFIGLINSSLAVSQNVLKQHSKEDLKFLKEAHSEFLKSIGASGKLKSATGTSIPSLQLYYCSEDAAATIVPGMTIPPEATEVVWEIKTNIAGEGSRTHSDWIELVDNGFSIVFYPERVDSKYYGANIIFNYAITQNGVNITGGSGGDITKVYKTPDLFSFGSDIEICSGTSTGLTLNNSETGVSYVLMRDGVEVTGQEVDGVNGFPITFDVSQAGTYTVNAKTPYCSKMMNGSAVVTVNPKPVLTVSPNIAICVGQSVPLSASSDMDPDVDYSWSSGDNTANITVSPVATTTYTVTATNRITGCSASRTVTVTVNPLPEVTIINPSPVCLNEPLVLSANVTGGAGPYTYTWTLPDNSTSSSTSLTLTPASLAANGLYKLVVRDSRNCGSVEVSSTVVVNDLPNITLTALPAGDVCANTSITFTASGGTTYEFYLNGTLVQPSSANATYVLANPVNGDVVKVVGTDGNSCISEDSYTVVVNPLPVTGIIATPSATSCAGGNITFTATGGSQYLFYVNGVAQGTWSATNTFTSSTLNNGDQVHAMVRSAANCEAPTTTITVTINEAVATLSSNPAPAVVCENDYINFTAGGGVSFEFLVNGTVAQALSATNTFATNTLTNGQSVTVRIIDANGCEDISDPIVVTINPLPVVTLSAAPAGAVCPGTPIVFTGHGATQYAFLLNGVEVQARSNNATYTLAAPANGDVVAVIGYNANNCSLESADYTVIVNPLPVTSLSVAPSETACKGSLLTFTATGGSQYLFYVNGVAQGTWSATNTFTSSTLNNGDQVHAMVRSADGCEAPTTTITVTINEAVATLSSNPAPAVVCENDYINFTAGGGVSYEFLVNGTVAQALSATNTFATNTLTNGQSVTVRIVDANGCEDISDPIVVTINPLPVVTMSASPSGAVCPGTPIVFTGSGATQYAFLLNGVVVQARSNNATYTLATPTNGDVVAVIGYNANNCSLESTDYTVIVNPLPVTSLSVAPSATACKGSLLTFTATGGSQYLFYVNGIAQGTWSATNTFTSSTLNNGDQVHAMVRSAASCEAPTTPITVTINEAVATLSSNPAPAVVCENDYINFTAGGGVSYEFLVDGTVVQALSATNTFATNTLTNGQSVTVRIIDANGCEDISDPIVVTINPLPVVTMSASPSGAVCPGTPIVFTGSGATQYAFLLNGVVVQARSNNATYTLATPTNGDVVAVIGYNANNCSLESADYTVIVNPLPVTSLSVAPSAAVCKGTLFTFTATGGSQYLFYVNGVAQGTWSATNTFSTSSLNNGDVVHAMVRSAASCEAPTTPITVTINEAVATLSSNLAPAVVCENDYINFTAGGGVSYEFLVNGTVAQALSATNTFATNTLTNGQSVTVRIVDANGCEDISDPIVVTVNPLPAVTLSASPAGAVCPETPVVFTGHGAVEYAFLLNGVEVQARSANATFTLSTPSNGDIVAVVGYNANNCSLESADYTVTVNPAPVGVLTVSPAASVCIGDLTTFTASGGSEYRFYVNGTVQGTWSSVNTFSSTTLHNGDQVYADVRSAAGCVAQTNIITVTVNQVTANLSVTSPLPGVTTICQGNSVSFTASPAGAVQYEFFVTRAGVDISLYQGTNNVYTTNSVQNNDQVFVRVIDANNCVDVSDKITMSVVNLPVPVIDITPSPLCAGAEVTITATPGYDQYELFVNGAKQGATQVSNVFVTNTLVNGDQVAVVAYDVVNASLSCHGTSVAKTINFLPLPVITLSSDQGADTFCKNTNVIFTATGGAQYQFFVNGIMVQDFSASATWTSSSLNNGDRVTVIGRDAAGCTNVSNEITVVVNEAVAGLTSDDADNVVCVGQNIRFTATGGINYEFFVDNVSQGVSTVNTFDYTGLVDGAHQIYVVVEDANGCFAQSSSLDIQVLALPVASLVVDNTGFVCHGTQLEFVANGGVYYTFYVNDVEVQARSTNNVFITSSLNNGDKVHAIVANNDNCESASPDIFAQIWDLPVIDVAASKASLVSCENETIRFTASSPAPGIQYEFLINGVVVQALSNVDFYEYAGTSNYTVSVRGVDANGCVGFSSDVNVVVSQIDPTLSSVPAGAACFGETVTLTATGGTNYEFFRNGVSVQNSTSGTYLYSALDLGTHVFTVLVSNADGCSEMSNDLPLVVNDLPLGNITSDDLDNVVCAGESVTFTATGGDFYEFFIDGVSVQASSSINQYVGNFAGAGTFQVYAEVKNGLTGCSTQSNDIFLTVNPVPAASLSASPSLNIIEGTMMTFTAGEAGMEYEFYVGSTMVQTRSTNNIYTSDQLQDGDVVTVYVYNAFDCFSTATVTVHVLDGITPLDVVPANSSYCADANGVTISVTNPQAGITYRLVHKSSGDIVGTAIEFDGTNTVQWSDIKIHNGENPSEFIVEAFYALLPAEVVAMANSAFVTEDALPVVYKLDPYNAEFEDCGGGNVLSLENSEIGVSYSLLLNGNPIGVAIDGTGARLDFGSQNMIGVYTIEARNVATGCSQMMDGTYTIKGEAVQQFAMTSNPANGNYCENSAGVEIGIDGSETGVTYHLYRDGGATGVSVVGTGAAVSFGNVAVDGVYSVFIESAKGCLYPMTGSVQVTKYALPLTFDVTATNNGHFCDGDAGVQITVSGQQDGYTYTLLLNGAPLVPSVTYVGLPASETTPFTFAGLFNTPGTYSVEASVAHVDCPSAMNNSVSVVADALPTHFTLQLEKSTICEGDVTSILLLGSELDVDYTLHHVGSASDVATISGNGGLITFTGITMDGEYVVNAVRTGSVTACSTSFGSVTLTKVDRPLYQVGDVWLEVVAPDPADMCGTASIFVRNAQEGFTYQLYRKFTSGLQAVGGKVFVATANPDDNVFTGISDVNGEYHVVVNNGSCEEQLEDFVTISTPGAVTVFEVIGDGEICNGDPGVRISLSGSEINVTYQLIRVATNVVLETQNGTGNALNFNTLLRQPGDYKIVGVSDAGCEADMAPFFTLNVNPLPVSYRIVGSGNYCAGGLGAEIKLENSELGVTYILQRIDNNLEEVATVQGTGNEIVFGRFTEGVYQVVAYNETTLCTSSMEGRVVIVENAAIDTTIGIDVETQFCSNSKGALLVIHTPQENVLYELINDADEVVAKYTGAAGNGDYSYHITVQGHYRLRASYGGDGCLQILREFDIVRNEAPSTKFDVTSSVTDGCGSSGALITLSGSEDGIAYVVNIYEPNTTDVLTSDPMIGDGQPLEWDVTYNGSGMVRYEVVASVNNQCELVMGEVTINYKPSPTVLDLDSTPVAFCTSDGGVTISLPAGAENGVYYRLFAEGSPRIFLKGVEASATSTAFDGLYGGGTYVIQAVNLTTGCSVWMNNSVVVVENPNPDIAASTFYFELDGKIDPKFGMINVGNLVVSNTVDTYSYKLNVTLADGSSYEVQTIVGTGGDIVFDPVVDGGVYRVEVIDMNTGCTSWIDGSITVTENPLLAFDGFLNLKTTEVSSTLDIINEVPAMIKYAVGVDKIYSLDGITSEDQANIEFELDTEFAYTTPGGETALFTTIGDAKLNPVTGLLEYTKRVGFFGSDSVRYIIRNKDIPGREDYATIFIFVGNNQVDDDHPFLIPNAFSPNGDGINDKFVVSVPSAITDYKSKLEVFNRWGTVVYQSKGTKYDNSWDGKSTGAAMFSIGDDLPSGTYFYVFKITFTEGDKHLSKELSGYIELRR